VTGNQDFKWGVFSKVSLVYSLTF